MQTAETVRYASLIQARREIKELDTTVDAVADARILDALFFVSARIDAITEQTFAPYVATRYYDAFGDYIDAATGRLLLDTPLLAVTTLTVGGQSLAAGTDYVTQPRGATPITSLRLLPAASVDWSSYADDWQDSIVLTGIWGHRSDYGSAFVSSGGTVLDNPLTAGGTTLTVTSISGSDARGRAPRFSAGQVLGLTTDGTTEYVEVLATAISSGVTPVHTLSIRRAARKSAAVAHAAGTVIRIWAPEPDIERAALLWASYLYKRRGQFEQVSFDGVTTTRWPKDAPGEVTNILSRYFDPAAWGAVG